MNSWEDVAEGKRVRWPWDTLKEVGQSYEVCKPANIRNARQSICQANKRSEKKYKGCMRPDGVYVVTRVV